MLNFKVLASKLIPKHDSAGVQFTYQIGWAKEYGALFRNELVRVTDVEGAIEHIRDRGRAIIVGKGGSGKSTILGRLVADAVKRKAFAITINLKHWSASFQKVWDVSDVASRGDLLLSKLAEPRLSLDGLDRLPPRREKWIFIDGLNEVRSSVADQIIAVADKLANSFTSTSVVVTDRIVRRDLETDRWVFGIVCPLDEIVVKGALSKTIGLEQWDHANLHQRRLLDNPFFLNKTIQEGRLAINNAEAIQTFLREHATLTDDSMGRASVAAFVAYSTKSGSRTFSLSAFEGVAGRDVVAELVRSGALIIENNDAYFEHHLIHDYLASRHVAAHPSTWNENTLDVITFDASSYDAVALVLQELALDQSDEFLKRVYDWNPYAAAYAIAESEGSGVSDEMKLVISAMLAERLGDTFELTAQRSADALSVLGTSHAKMFLTATNPQIRQVVGDYQSDQEWFLRWRSLFATAADSNATSQQIEDLQNQDPIIGWTAANVLRRLRMTQEAMDDVRQLTAPPAINPVRWRAVHVLGAFANSENVETLTVSMRTDSYHWVRYGSLRSLMEIAAKSLALRRGIFNAFMEDLDLLEDNSRLSSEFRRASLARRPEGQNDWTASLGRIIRALADRTSDTAKFNSWIRLASEVASYYGSVED